MAIIPIDGVVMYHVEDPNALPAQISDTNMHAPDVHPRFVVLCGALAIIVAGSFSAIAAAEDRLLQETVEFTGAITFLEHKVPGLVIGAVRNGERAIAGFGTTSTGSSAVPDGKTIFRIGSVTANGIHGPRMPAQCRDGKWCRAR